MRAEIFGNIMHEPETVTSKAGNTYVQFDVCDRTAGKDKKVYVKVLVFGNRGDKMLPYLHHGTPIRVIGHLDARAYTNNAGETKCALSAVADQIDFVPKDYSSDNGAPAQAAPKQNTQAAPANDLDCDYIPF